MMEIYWAKRIDNSRVSRPKAPHRMRECARFVTLGGFLALCLLLYAWQHFQTIQYRYQLETLRGERSQAAELNQRLKLEAAGLLSPDRVSAIARDRLGLTVPAPGQVARMELPAGAVVAQAHSPNDPAAQQ